MASSSTRFVTVLTLPMSWFDGGYTAQERTAAGIVGMNRRGQRTKWIIPVVVAACYALFTLAVHLRMLDFSTLRSAARPMPAKSGDQCRYVRPGSSMGSSPPISWCHLCWSLWC